MDLSNKEGLNIANPKSLPILLIFIPPNAVAFALWGNSKKLNTELPAVVCATPCLGITIEHIKIIDSKNPSPCL